jgi:hypothetical protein
VIRAILLVGWVGLALLVATAAGGGRLAGNEGAIQGHLALALFPAATLHFANLCVLVSVGASGRLVRRTTAELGLGADWSLERRGALRESCLWAAAGALAVVFLFGSGFPVYVAWWPRWVHVAGAATAFLLQLGFLLRTAPALRRSEARLKELGAAAEAAGAR